MRNLGLLYADLRKVFQNYAEIIFLVDAVEGGEEDARKQLADAVLCHRRSFFINGHTRAKLRRWAGVD